MRNTKEQIRRPEHRAEDAENRSQWPVPRRRCWRQCAWIAWRLYVRALAGLLLVSAMLYSTHAPLQYYTEVHTPQVTADAVAGRLIYFAGLVGTAVAARSQLAGGVLAIAAGVGLAIIPLDADRNLASSPLNIPPGIQVVFLYCGAGLLFSRRRGVPRFAGGADQDGAASSPTRRSSARPRRNQVRFRLSSLLLAMGAACFACGALTTSAVGPELPILAALVQLSLPLACGFTAANTRSLQRTTLQCGTVAIVSFGALLLILTWRAQSSFFGHGWQVEFWSAGLGMQLATIPYHLLLLNAVLLGTPFAAIASLGAVCGLAGWMLRRIISGNRIAFGSSG